jgi:hypothetical protein
MLTDRLRAVADQVADLLDRAEPDQDPPTDEARVLFAEAVTAIRTGGAPLLDTVTPYLWEYYEDRADACGTDDWDMAPLADGADIWEHVELELPPDLHVGFGPPTQPSPCYVSFVGEVPWEPEHGLQVVFDHSGTVVRVGTFGSLTNTGGLAGEIYAG